MTRAEAGSSSTAAEAASSAPIGLGLGVALGVALGFAFSPSLVAAADSLRTQAWTRGTLIFPLLVAVAAWSAPRATRSAVGWGLIGVGIAIQLVAIGGGVVRAGRLGFVVAAIGLGRGAGWCGWRPALLLAFLLPLPHALVELGSPGLAGGFAEGGAAIARAFGLGVETGRGVLTAGAATLRLADHDGGLGLLALLAGLGAFVELRRPSRSAGQRLARAGVCLAAAAGCQLTFLTVAAIALGTGGEPATARWILDQLPWLLTFTFGIVLAVCLGPERRREGT